MQRPNLVILFFALLAGVGLGLAYSWLISPVEYTNSTPNILRADFKDQYRLTIAAAYAANNDIERARARLSLLGDGDSFQALSAQAQQMLASGRPYEDVEQIVQLASALQGQKIVSAVTPQSTFGPQFTALPTFTATFSLIELTTTPQTNPQILATATRRPTQTPSPTPGAALILLSREEICNPDAPEGILQVNVIDGRRRALPGAEFIITWNGGEEHFFTGFKPELGNGYADFQMTSDILYSLKPESAEPIPDITAPTCTSGDNPFIGGLKFTFQMP